VWLISGWQKRNEFAYQNDSTFVLWTMTMLSVTMSLLKDLYQFIATYSQVNISSLNFIHRYVGKNAIGKWRLSYRCFYCFFPKRYFISLLVKLQRLNFSWFLIAEHYDILTKNFGQTLQMRKQQKFCWLLAKNNAEIKTMILHSRRVWINLNFKFDLK
jgi:hypothetical protein